MSFRGPFFGSFTFVSVGRGISVRRKPPYTSQRILVSAVLPVGRHLPDRPLDFKQFSFIHVIQDSGFVLCYTASQFTPLPTCYCPVRVSSFGK
jgi:hypothetical protein